MPRGKTKTTKSKKKANPKNLKKTTAKGAYKKSTKKNFMKRRNPFVENKIRNYREFTDKLDPIRSNTPLNFPDPTDFEAIPIDDAYTTFLPIPFYHMNRGLNNNEMIGTNIYVKYLKSKFQFLAPEGAHMIDYPCQVYLVHGWVTQPFAATENSDPSSADATFTDMLGHITSYVKEYFDDRKDTLDFPRKKKQHIKILGYRKLHTNKNKEIPVQGVSDVATSRGALAPINISCRWDVMRKVHYTKGANNSHLGSVSTYPMADFNYPNESWLPFAIFYNPQFASTPSSSTNDLWRVATNSAMWYSDS